MGMSATSATPPTYNVRPAYRERVSVNKMKEIIKTVMRAELEGKSYDSDKCTGQSKKIADDIRNQLKAQNLPRYKYYVQVVIGQQRGEGVRMGCRTFWDADTDASASETFVNDSLFCVATAYAVYLY